MVTSCQSGWGRAFGTVVIGLLLASCGGTTASGDQDGRDQPLDPADPIEDSPPPGETVPAGSGEEPDACALGDHPSVLDVMAESFPDRPDGTLAPIAENRAYDWTPGLRLEGFVPRGDTQPRYYSTCSLAYTADGGIVQRVDLSRFGDWATDLALVMAIETNRSHCPDGQWEACGLTVVDGVGDEAIRSHVQEDESSPPDVIVRAGEVIFEVGIYVPRSNNHELAVEVARAIAAGLE